MITTLSGNDNLHTTPHNRKPVTATSAAKGSNLPHNTAVLSEVLELNPVKLVQAKLGWAMSDGIGIVRLLHVRIAGW